MIEFLGSSFFGSSVFLREAQDRLQQVGSEKGVATELSKDERKWVGFLAKSAEEHCAAIGLDEAALLANGLHWRASGPQSCNYERAVAELTAIISLMSVGLSKQRFVFVPRENQEWFENDNLFEIAMPFPFPEAVQDIRDAGNCLALALHTAAVFHLMRVAEHGVRRLITDLNVTIPSRPCLEDADWSELIKALNDKIIVLSTPSPKRGTQEQKEVERLTTLISEARTLKNFRNPTMHCRVVYNVHEAKNILVHVRSFIQRVFG